MKKALIPFVLAVLLAFTVVSVSAGSISYPWENHAAPFSFMFGNHIDVHQQSMIRRGLLKGFLYIRFTGQTTADAIPVAEHANCGMMPEDCSVGWTFYGVPVEATLLAHEASQHPTWCVDPADVPDPDFSHFHWLGAPEHPDMLIAGQSYPGYLLKLRAVDTFFFMHHGGFLLTPGVDALSHANIVTDCP